MKLLRVTLSKFRLPLLVIQWAGNLLLLLFAFLWLQIPDSHAWQFALSILSALLLALAFCWLHVFTFTRLRATRPSSPLWIRLVSFAALVLIWLFAANWIASGNDHLWLYAADWNSKLSPSHRVTFTPQRIQAFLHWCLVVAQLVLAGLLIPAAIELGAGGFRRSTFLVITRAWRRVLFWIAVILAGVCGILLTTALVSWTPGHSVAAQTFSVLTRLLIAWIADIFLWMVVLFVAAAAMDGPLPVADEVATVA
jgi:hypothetical protein